MISINGIPSLVTTDFNSLIFSSTFTHPPQPAPSTPLLSFTVTPLLTPTVTPLLTPTVTPLLTPTPTPLAPTQVAWSLLRPSTVLDLFSGGVSCYSAERLRNSAIYEQSVSPHDPHIMVNMADQILGVTQRLDL